MPRKSGVQNAVLLSLYFFGRLRLRLLAQNVCFLRLKIFTVLKFVKSQNWTNIMGKYIVVFIMKLTVHMLRRHFVSIHSDGLTFPRSLSNLSTPIASHTVETTYNQARGRYRQRGKYDNWRPGWALLKNALICLWLLV